MQIGQEPKELSLGHFSSLGSSRIRAKGKGAAVEVETTRGTIHLIPMRQSSERKGKKKIQKCFPSFFLYYKGKKEGNISALRVRIVEMKNEKYPSYLNWNGKYEDGNWF